ncbi:hypothetical protein M153_2200049921 [Pseudoloma neurophilia]|uniref:Late embryogenesis abundant protein LEA-2 subgroup domain-containing protein n=1 Tax=Pseudoloma neurophilia TaxID=146866 RepID=A0A0R0M122_9MICR|nr:hypothetical protein M153_2200049921 [Pseudoloma neurophilia]
MFFLYFLYKKYPRACKRLLFIIISVMVVFMMAMYHLFKNIEIAFTVFDINPKNGISFEMRVKNRSFFNVKLEDIKLEVEKFNLGKAQQVFTAKNGSKTIKKFKPENIKAHSVNDLDLFFRILEEFDEPFQGNIMIVMNKFGIKVPFEQKISA